MNTSSTHIGQSQQPVHSGNGTNAGQHNPSANGKGEQAATIVTAWNVGRREDLRAYWPAKRTPIPQSPLNEF